MKWGGFVRCRLDVPQLWRAADPVEITETQADKHKPTRTPEAVKNPSDRQ